MSHEMEILGGPGVEAAKKSVMCIMNHTGDVKVIWDADVKVEVDAAKAQFDTLRKQGYSAFKVNKKGEAGERITEFDPHAEKLIMVPQLQGG